MRTIPAEFVEGAGRRRFEWLVGTIQAELELQGVTHEPGTLYLAEQVAARLLRDEREAFLANPAPRY